MSTQAIVKEFIIDYTCIWSSWANTKIFTPKAWQ